MIPPVPGHWILVTFSDQTAPRKQSALGAHHFL